MVQQSASDSDSSAAMSEKKNTSQFVAFHIDDQQYAFPIEEIQEIVILDRITQMPDVADYVEGVSNLRGAIIPIINLRRLFGLQPKPIDEETRTIVVNVGDRTIGCTVDMVSQVIRIPVDSIRPAPETVTANGATYVSGFVKLDHGLVILLNISELLNPERLEQNRRSELPVIPSSS